LTRSPLILYLFRQMDHRAAPAPADTLPSSICLELAHTLRKNLPAPVTDSPDDAARWERAAIEHAASLLPATADEANLAALYVAASAQALDCLRLARLYPNDTAVVLRCTAQSASMMRQARAFRTALDRAQTARRKREAAPDADAAGHQPLAPVTDAPAQARGGTLRAAASQARGADPPPGPPATEIRLAGARGGARHRHRHHTDPVRAR
jgi:hypothetical protein